MCSNRQFRFVTGIFRKSKSGTHCGKENLIRELNYHKSFVEFQTVMKFKWTNWMKTSQFFRIARFLVNILLEQVIKELNWRSTEVVLRRKFLDLFPIFICNRFNYFIWFHDKAFASNFLYLAAITNSWKILK